MAIITKPAAIKTFAVVSLDASVDSFLVNQAENCHTKDNTKQNKKHTFFAVIHLFLQVH